MSDLKKALAAVGESAPDAPATWDLPWGDGYLAKHDPLLAWRSERKHGRAIESLALRLAVRLERAEKPCPVCAARNSVYPPIDEHVVTGLRCSRCGLRVDATIDGLGTDCCYGKEQPR